MNEGTNKEPRFSGRNIPVLAGDAPFQIPGATKMTAPRLVDWDKDGDMDLIAGSFGDSYGEAEGGGIYLFLNEGQVGSPAFAAPKPLIPPSPKGQQSPTRPDAGLYVDATDYDGDGDLDLVVGGYSMWTPPGRELNAEEKQQVAELREKQSALQQERTVFFKKMNDEIASATQGIERKAPAYRERAAEVRKHYAKELKAYTDRSLALKKDLEALVPSKQRRSFVWLYERK